MATEMEEEGEGRGLCCRQQCGGREKECLACLSGFSQQTGGGNGKKPWQTPHTLLQDSSHFVLRNRLSPLKLHKVEKSTRSKDDGRETKKKLFLLGRRGRKESAINVKGGASHPPRVQECKEKALLHPLSPSFSKYFFPI